MKTVIWHLGISFLVQIMSSCWCIRHEGLALLAFRGRVEVDPYRALWSWGGGEDHCFWYGVGCSDGKVVSLILENLYLKGLLAPELAQLSHLKLLILRNNSFYGPVPTEIQQLKHLEILDLGGNHLSKPLPPELGKRPGRTLFLPEDILFSEFHSQEIVADIAHCGYLNKHSCFGNMDRFKAGAVQRKLMQMNAAHSPPKGQNIKKKKRFKPRAGLSGSSAQSPAPTPMSSSLNNMVAPPKSSRAPSPSAIMRSPSSSLKDLPSAVPSPPSLFVVPTPSVVNLPSSTEAIPQTHRLYVYYLSIGVGLSLAIGFAAICLFLCRKNKVVTVKPWVTGLSGQLQKAFVTGVPKLKRVELEIACEDFSNIIGILQENTLYKGTLSSGVEIAVISSSVTSAKEWSKHLETEFRKKIDTLSKINHKNFINLLGYCEEEEPFTRMMVFEYAPNGTLFEHIHVKEAEHLDWPARLRIAMGMAYCLEHMHQLNPPLIHRSLHSAVVYLTDDFAAKISDWGFWNVEEAVKTGSGDSGLLDTSPTDRENNVYNFGLILLEMITGKLQYSNDEGPLVFWASNFLSGTQPLKLMLDPTLTSFSEEEAIALCQVIRSCINPDPKQRPTMREVVSQLKEVTAIGPDGATPRLSALWWAELEILSAEAN